MKHCENVCAIFQSLIIVAGHNQMFNKRFESSEASDWKRMAALCACFVAASHTVGICAVSVDWSTRVKQELQ